MVLNPKQNQDVGGFGGNKPATIWRAAMAPILEARGSGQFPPADPVVVNGNTRPVPGCGSVSSCRSALAAAGFVAQTVTVNGSSPAGSLLGTSPPAGGRAVVGQVVTIRVSNGASYVPPAPAPAPGPAPGPAPPPGLPVPGPPVIPGLPTN